LEQVEHWPLDSQDSRKLSSHQTDLHSGPASAPFFFLPCYGAAAGERYGIGEGDPSQNSPVSILD
jgi:hypothetical protein